MFTKGRLKQKEENKGFESRAGETLELKQVERSLEYQRMCFLPSPSQNVIEFIIAASLDFSLLQEILPKRLFTNKFLTKSILMLPCSMKRSYPSLTGYRVGNVQ